MTLTILGVLMISVSFVPLLISTVYFLSHMHMLFGFENETKEAEATITRFGACKSDDYGNLIGGSPFVEYYNEFLGQNVEKEMFNSRMINSRTIDSRSAFAEWEKQRAVNVGDKVKVQYTTKRVRVIDSRFVTDNTYKISRFLFPIIASLSIGFVGFVVLLISIIM